MTLPPGVRLHAALLTAMGVACLGALENVAAANGD
jgi:hypothetical protein